MKDSLKYIYKQQKELSTFGGISALLGWDQMTYMPNKGAMERAEQSALISRLSHDKVLSDELWRHITKLSDNKNFENLSQKDKSVVKRLKKDVEKSRKVPSDFVERASKTTTMAYPAWQQARKNNDFSEFKPHLEKIVSLQKEYCDYINFPGSDYDCLLDDYEEGMTTEKLKKEFSYLRKNLVSILDKIKSSEFYQKNDELKINFSEELQRKLCDIVIEKMGIPKDRSRIDVSTHPFTTSIGYDDVRITTNFERSNPLFSFFSTVHEAGHGLYELNMPRGEYENTVISDSPSLGLHESQSRFWENMIARNNYFWKYFFSIFKDVSPEKFKGIEIENWYKHINQVKPSLIRVDADELTYCLHVILRFEIELGLMEEKIKVSELPQIWNQKMDELLGITPKTNTDGVLQDMHWSGGSIGYFPTYAIGTIYASQIFYRLKKINQNLNNEIQKGDFNNILNWLEENIHRYGRLFTADEIIKKACGEGLNSKIFVDYLKDKYYPIYEI